MAQNEFTGPPPPYVSSATPYGQPVGQSGTAPGPGYGQPVGQSGIAPGPGYGQPVGQSGTAPGPGYGQPVGQSGPGYGQQQYTQQQPYYVQQQAYPQTTTVVQQHPVVSVVGIGNCPRCRVGNVIESYSMCGICLAIFFFPLGLICCLLMMEKRCSHCGVYM